MSYTTLENSGIDENYEKLKQSYNHALEEQLIKSAGLAHCRQREKEANIIVLMKKANEF